MSNTTEKTNNQTEPQASELENQVWSALRLCYDPEIPVNIVDLGLVYSVELTNSNNVDKRCDVKVRMTFTNAACPMCDFILNEVRNRVKTLSFVNNVDIELVFDPPWDRSMISTQAKLELGIL